MFHMEVLASSACETATPEDDQDNKGKIARGDELPLSAQGYGNLAMRLPHGVSETSDRACGKVCRSSRVDDVHILVIQAPRPHHRFG